MPALSAICPQVSVPLHGHSAVPSAVPYCCTPCFHTGLVAAYSQLERAQLLACNGDFVGCHEAYGRLQAQLRSVAAGVGDTLLRREWEHCLRRLEQEQQLARAWERECAVLAAWAERQVGLLVLLVTHLERQAAACDARALTQARSLPADAPAAAPMFLKCCAGQLARAHASLGQQCARLRGVPAFQPPLCTHPLGL
jgi:hypothetical protein